MLIMMMTMAMQLIGKIKNKNKYNSHDAAFIIMIHNRIVVRSCLRRTDRSRLPHTVERYRTPPLPPSSLLSGVKEAETAERKYGAS